MSAPAMRPDTPTVATHAPHHEKGFAFRVPFCERRRTADRLRRIARENDHVFEVDRVGLLGSIRCTFRQRNDTRVMSLVAEHLRDRRVRVIDDYQRRYGVAED